MRRLNQERKLLRGLTSFEAKLIALLLLFVFVSPSLSKASPDPSNISMSITVANSTVRGELLNISANLAGQGNVSFTWILPSGFVPLQSTTGTCALPCQQNLTVNVSAPAIGREEVKLEVKYA